MEENTNPVNNTFKSVNNPNNFNNKKNKKNSSSFTRSVAIPLLSGVLGATLTIGTCFGVSRN